MTKPGHEAPLFDSTDSASMAGPADEAQLRIGAEPPELISVPELVEDPPGLKLTDKEQARVDRLIDQGLGRGTAVSYTVPTSKRNRIIGHHNAERIIADIERSVEKRKSETVQPGPSDAELLELMKSTFTEKSNDKTNEAA